MNRGDLNTTLEKIASICENITVTAESAVVNENRTGQLRNYAGLVKDAVMELSKSESFRLSERAIDALLLLSVCLEDINSFLAQFAIPNEDLAISIIKGGSHPFEFLKLTEQLEHCCILVNLDIQFTDADGFEKDSSNLIASLPIILKALFKEFNTKKAYKGNRYRNDDVTMKSDDLEIIKPFGKGGFATVWLGKFRGETVAVKVLSMESSNITIQEFQHEADLMRRLSNKNIVAYYGITQIANSQIFGHCMIMEYMANDSLYTFIKKNADNELVWAKKVDIALDIASGNILLDENLNAKVADFGMSFAKNSAHSTYNMNEGGTIPYMAPECFGANTSYSTKSDVFAFAIVCWGIMHWDLPFRSYEREAIKNVVWKERFRLPVDPKIPIALSSMIKLCWQQSYTHRPTMIDVKQFLGKLVYIDGIEMENPIFMTEMTTSATIPLDLVGADNSNLLRVEKATNQLVPESSNKIVSSKSKEWPELESYKKRNSYLMIALIIAIFLLIGGGLLVYFIGLASRANANITAAVTNVVATTTTANSPIPTVKTLIQDVSKLYGVSGITVDENDVIYVVRDSFIYQVNQGLPVSLRLIVNLANYGQNNSDGNQGLCYFNRSLYVPTRGQLTKIDLANNFLVTRFAGTGIEGSSKTMNDGQNSSAIFCGAMLCIADSIGNIYVGDDCSAIRKVNQSGFVSTLSTGLIDRANGFAPSSDGRLLFTAWTPSVVFGLDLASNEVSLVAGNPAYPDKRVHTDGQGEEGRFNSPSGVAMDKLGNLYVTETFGNAISRVNTTNYVSQFAGTLSNLSLVDGVGLSAVFSHPKQIVFDSKGRLLVADLYNNAIRVVNW